jgi:hypothetical protein
MYQNFALALVPQPVEASFEHDFARGVVIDTS